ncbi:MAG: hypothetical protein U1F57_05610 [bacterium]
MVKRIFRAILLLALCACSGGGVGGGTVSPSPQGNDTVVPLSASGVNSAAPMHYGDSSSPGADHTEDEDSYLLKLNDSFQKNLEDGNGNSLVSFKGTVEKEKMKYADVHFLRIVDLRSRTFINTPLVALAEQPGAFSFEVNFPIEAVTAEDLYEKPNKVLLFFVSPLSAISEEVGTAKACENEHCLKTSDKWTLVLPENPSPKQELASPPPGDGKKKPEPIRLPGKK